MTNQIKNKLRQASTSTAEATKCSTDMDPMDGEPCLAAVGGCFMSNLLAAIRGPGSGDFRRPYRGDRHSRRLAGRFSAVELNVTADSLGRELLERVVEIADRACIMMNTLRGKLDLRIRIGMPV